MSELMIVEEIKELRQRFDAPVYAFIKYEARSLCDTALALYAENERLKEEINRIYKLQRYHLLFEDMDCEMVEDDDGGWIKHDEIIKKRTPENEQLKTWNWIENKLGIKPEEEK